MPDITPNDIINKEFRTVLRGYPHDEVDEFLQEVSEALYLALQENQRLRGQVDSLREQVGRYQETEGLIKNALVLAERTADEVRLRAQQDADLLRREAELRLSTERQAVEDLRETRRRITAELRATLNAHMELLQRREGVGE